MEKKLIAWIAMSLLHKNPIYFKQLRKVKLTHVKDSQPMEVNNFWELLIVYKVSQFLTGITSIFFLLFAKMYCWHFIWCFVSYGKKYFQYFFTTFKTIDQSVHIIEFLYVIGTFLSANSCRMQNKIASSKLDFYNKKK